MTDDDEIAEAIRACRAAGVPDSVIARELRESAQQPQDELEPIILAARLYGYARRARHRSVDDAV
jgi:hypothetical protein